MDNKKITRILKYESVDELSDAVCDSLFQSISDCDRSNYFIALSGGTTPMAIYRRVAERSITSIIPWDKVHFFWSDERCVPPDHPESNFKMAYDSLLGKISVPSDNIHRIKGEAPVESEAGRYTGVINDLIEDRLNGIPIFDWIFLGLGLDGHTASLFPDSPVLTESKRICAAANHPQTGQDRLTFTFPLINSARRISFLATGSEKSAVVSEILGKKKGYEVFPASRVQPIDGHLDWYLDSRSAESI